MSASWHKCRHSSSPFPTGRPCPAASNRVLPSPSAVHVPPVACRSAAKTRRRTQGQPVILKRRRAFSPGRGDWRGSCNRPRAEANRDPLPAGAGSGTPPAFRPESPVPSPAFAFASIVPSQSPQSPAFEYAPATPLLAPFRIGWVRYERKCYGRIATHHAQKPGQKRRKTD